MVSEEHDCTCICTVDIHKLYISHIGLVLCDIHAPDCVDICIMSSSLVDILVFIHLVLKDLAMYTHSLVDGCEMLSF